MGDISQSLYWQPPMIPSNRIPSTCYACNEIYDEGIEWIFCIDPYVPVLHHVFSSFIVEFYEAVAALSNWENDFATDENWKVAAAKNENIHNGNENDFIIFFISNVILFSLDLM
jgi:hypothetical protein